MAKAPAVTKPRATALATTSFSDDLADLKSRLAAPGGDKIKAENKQFKLPSGATAEELDIVIVDFIHFNAYYETNYTKGVVSAPGCAALGLEPMRLIPLPAGTAIQNAGCDGCAQNQFGSKGAGKACQNRILVAVLPADADETTPLALFDLPPTSIQQFQKYVASVAGTLQRPPYGVITHVSFDQNETYTKLIFSDPQPFDMEDEDDVAQVNLIRSRRAEARERLLTPPDLTAVNDAAAAPVKKSALKAPVRRRA